MSKEKCSSDEERWRAEDDAHILAQYQEIVADKKRLSKAADIAKEKAVELEKRAKAMKKVASKGGKSNAKTKN